MKNSTQITSETAIVIIGLSRFDNALNSSTACIARELARSYRVFYIDKPFSYKDYIQENQLNPISSRKSAILYGKNYCRWVEKDGVGFYVVTPRMCLPLNFLPDGKLYDWAANYNLGLVRNVIKRILKDFNIKNYIYFNSFLPTYFDVIPRKVLPPVLKIYRSCDDISQEKYIARHGVRLEAAAAQKADLLLASSFKIREHLEKLGNKPAYRVANAVDPDVFYTSRSQVECPTEIAHAKGRVLTFSGRLSGLRIDYPLLFKIASLRPFDTLLIVGLANESELEEYGLRALKNVVFVGLKPLNELAAYLVWSDVMLIPFLKNKLTESIYPLKINEYLAAGKPVVSTDFSEDIKCFAPVISVAATHEDFLTAISNELDTCTQEKVSKLREIALENTWAKRAVAIKQLINEALLNKEGQ